MPASSDDAAATTASAEEAAERDSARTDAILARVDAHGKALFGMVDRETAIQDLDAALAIVDELESEDLQTALRALVEAVRAHALGFLELRLDGSIEAARAHFERARDLAAEVRKANPEAADNDGFRAFRLGVESQLVQIAMLQATDEDERGRLQRRLAEVQRKVAALSGPESEAFAESLQLLNRAAAAFQASARALATLDLERARDSTDEANGAIAEMESALEKAAGDEFFERLAELPRAFGPLVAAQQAYVSVLHDAIVGDVRERHVALLERADRQLRDGLERVKLAAAEMEHLVGQITGPFPIAQLEESVNGQREIFGNLRRLVEQGVSPKEVTRRSAPRLAGYFAISLAVILGGAKLSGIVPELRGIEVVYLVLIALVVAAGSSFGWEAMIRVLESLPWPSGRSRKDDEKQVAIS